MSEVPYHPHLLTNPVDALDLHLRLWSWNKTDDAVRVMHWFLESYVGGKYAGRVEPFAEALNNPIERATTTYVSPDVASLVTTLAADMPPDKLMSDDLPANVGFVVLGDCWEYMDFDVDRYIGKIPIRVIAWWRSPIAQPDGNGTKPGVMVALFADTPWAVHSLHGQSRFENIAHIPALLIDTWAWTFDTWWEDVGPEQKPDQHHQSEHVGQMRRNLLALWRFMQEEIVRPERVRMPRPALRRWHRTDLSVPEDGSIVAVHLRRYADHDDDHDAEHQPVIWTHRWWVRGHHRLNPKTGRKDIWVRPHLKGPDGLPIVVKPRVISVDR